MNGSCIGFKNLMSLALISWKWIIWFEGKNLDEIARPSAQKNLLDLLNFTMRLRHLVGGSTGPGYSLFCFHKQEKN